MMPKTHSMDLARDFGAVQQDISAALVNTIRVATRIAAEDVTFHRSSSSSFAKSLNCQTIRLLSLVQRLLQRAIPNFQATLVSLDSIDSAWSVIVDAVDALLERSDTCLDEINGRFRQQAEDQHPNLVGSRNRFPKKASALGAEELPKPQNGFENPADNYASPPFRPLLTIKPHATIPLEQSLDIREKEDGTSRQHPYEVEIGGYHYPPSVYTKTEPIRPAPFNESKAKFVDDYDGVLRMLDELKAANEIAIDLEHHDAHSYIGLVSLMQISTRQHDWIIDTLKPWRRKLAVLNEVFADPKILKVLHGAHMDIVWLQRDLGLYIVGLFDTHHASRVLSYGGGSLAFLLKKFIDFDAQKQYQTADWRLRPLPLEMLEYARSDTHFLLYIYDCMRNDLADRSVFHQDERNLLQDVLRRSNETALQTYEHPVYDIEQGLGRGGWFGLIQRNMTPMSREQFAVFRKIHQWRDAVARQEDEGIAFIMPNHVLFNIARALPRDMAGLLRVSHPISQIMRLRADNLLGLIRETIVDAVNELTLAEKVTEILQARPDYARKSGVTLPDAKITPRSGTSVTTSADNDSLVYEIKLSSSSFWGPAMGRHDIQPNSAMTLARYAHRMKLPVPDYPSDILTASDGGLPGKAGAFETPLSPLNDASVAMASRADRMIGKRKAESSLDQDATLAVPAYKGMHDVTAEERHTATNAPTKRVRRSSRQGSRTEEPVEVNGFGMDDKSLHAFDYDAAPSVLHDATSSLSGTTREHPFNPYSKALQASSGLRKKQDSRAVRSLTFKQ